MFGLIFSCSIFHHGLFEKGFGGQKGGSRNWYCWELFFSSVVFGSRDEILIKFYFECQHPAIYGLQAYTTNAKPIWFLFWLEVQVYEGRKGAREPKTRCEYLIKKAISFPGWTFFFFFFFFFPSNAAFFFLFINFYYFFAIDLKQTHIILILFI